MFFNLLTRNFTTFCKKTHIVSLRPGVQNGHWHSLLCRGLLQSHLDYTLGGKKNTQRLGRGKIILHAPVFSPPHSRLIFCCCLLMEAFAERGTGDMLLGETLQWTGVPSRQYSYLLPTTETGFSSGRMGLLGSCAT